MNKIAWFSFITPVYVFLCLLLSKPLEFCEKWTMKPWLYSTYIIAKMFAVKKITIHFDPEIVKWKKCLLISNHVNYIDWLMILMCMDALRKNNVIFSAKRSLANFSRFVKGTTKLNFIFLRRSIDYDRITLMEACSKMKKYNEYMAVLFPEGTLYDRKISPEINRQRSEKYNVPVTKNVLIPKTGGFEILVDQLCDDMDGIMDCTLIYEHKVSMFNFFKGIKTNVDIYIDRVDKSNTPSGTMAKRQFLMKIFRDKDARIEFGNLCKPEYEKIVVTPKIFTKIKFLMMRLRRKFSKLM